MRKIKKSELGLTLSRLTWRLDFAAGKSVRNAEQSRKLDRPKWLIQIYVVTS